MTGSSVAIGREISVSFNSLSGASRRPIAHTCSCELKLPVCYSTSLEFSDEFKHILSNEFSWIMDSV